MTDDSGSSGRGSNPCTPTIFRMRDMNKSTYLKLARLVRIFHSGWILVMFASQVFLFIENLWFSLIPFSMMGITVLGNIIFKGCPLTQLEQWLCRKGEPYIEDMGHGVDLI